MHRAYLSGAARALFAALFLAAAAPAALAQLTCPSPTPTPLVAAPLDVVLPNCEQANLQQFNVCEIRLTPNQAYSDVQAYTQLDVTATFTHNTTGASKLVHGFYDRLPNNQLVFKIRFNASEAGNWSYTTASTAPSTAAPSGASRSRAATARPATSPPTRTPATRSRPSPRTGSRNSPTATSSASRTSSPPKSPTGGR